MNKKAHQEKDKTLIVGLGRTGLSCARYLATHGLPVAIVDNREQPPALSKLKQSLPDAALFLGGFEAGVFEAADRLILSPGVSIHEPLIQAAITRGVPVIGDIELFAQAAAAPVVAITGSNGKSTVTTLLAEMAKKAGLRVSAGGNLGEPALDLLDPLTELYLLELSSFQLETTGSLQPKVAVVLNISPDHMDRHAGIEAYTGIKAKVYNNAGSKLFNRDDPLVMAMHRPGDDACFFTLEPPADGEFGLRSVDADLWLCRGEQRLLPASQLLISGRHNLANALAALALGNAAGLPMPAMLEGVRGYRGLPHRTQFVSEVGGVRWYNDSKGTNVGACIAALAGLDPGTGSTRTVLIAGGQGKGADFSALQPIVSAAARAVVLIGEAAPLIEQALQGDVPVVRADEMAQAVTLAAELAQPGDRVLLSPACASFDMFADYRARGESYIAAVRRLAQ